MRTLVLAIVILEVVLAVIGQVHPLVIQIHTVLLVMILGQVVVLAQVTVVVVSDAAIREGLSRCTTIYPRRR